MIGLVMHACSDETLMRWPGEPIGRSGLFRFEYKLEKQIEFDIALVIRLWEE